MSTKWLLLLSESFVLERKATTYCTCSLPHCYPFARTKVNSCCIAQYNAASLFLLKRRKKKRNAHRAQKLVVEIVDVGLPADWVKINVREAKDCFEVYALVPGLLREEVRVQSDPAGRLVITGEPEHADNPWGITPFRKVVSLPSRIDPLQTTAVVSLHGRLFVRVPFEQG